MSTSKTGKIKFSPWLVYGLVFIGLFFLGGLLWWQNGLKPVNSADREKIAFIVDRGETIAQIVGRLKKEKLIRDPFRFKLFLIFSGSAKKVQAGSYQLSPAMKVSEIINMLVKGLTDQRITIIEGLREEQIGEELIEKGFPLDPQTWRQEVLTGKLEGGLFPDTYFFPPKATQGAILKIIGRNFEKKVETGLKEEIRQSGLALNQILTFASIVERESREEKDRRLIAGILLKRWRKNWPLQADATVQYAVANTKCRIAGFFCDWWPKGLTQKDLQIKSTYNTYLYSGLPPAPICNPGLSSIKAVLNPEDSPYWYYLNDNDGVMHYAKTDAEQAKNIQRYLK